MQTNHHKRTLPERSGCSIADQDAEICECGYIIVRYLEEGKREKRVKREMIERSIYMFVSLLDTVKY